MWILVLARLKDPFKLLLNKKNEINEEREDTPRVRLNHPFLVVRGTVWGPLYLLSPPLSQVSLPGPTGKEWPQPSLSTTKPQPLWEQGPYLIHYSWNTIAIVCDSFQTPFYINFTLQRLTGNDPGANLTGFVWEQHTPGSTPALLNGNLLCLFRCGVKAFHMLGMCSTTNL